jgi:small-conductance mechanosensitive channel
MSYKLIHIALILSTWFAARPLAAGEVIDRIVATVNGHIILESEVDEALCYQAFADDRPLAAFSAEQRKAALDRLIDQELIREEVQKSGLQAASPAEVEARIAEIRKLHAEVSDQASWLAALHRYDLTADELRERVTADLNSWKAIDARLRPSVAVDSRSIQRYYQENLLPELHKKGAPEVPLTLVAPKIKEILAQQQMNDLLVNWLKSLRTESNIQIAWVPGTASREGRN